MEVIDATGNSTLYSYDELGNLIRETDANENSVTYDYDALDQLITITDALDHQTWYAYDPVGNRINETDANGHTTRYQYDALNRLIKEIDATNNETSYTYDAVGNLLNITDARGNTTGYEYDELDRRTKTVSPLGYETRYDYDDVGNILNRTDANDNLTTYGYDALNRLVSTSYLDGSSVTNAYDAEGNVVTVTNTGGLGEVTYNTYDELNRLESTAVDYGSFAKTVNYTYDEVGNRATMKDPNGVTSYSYDNVSRLLSITDPSNDVTTYSYDNAGRRIGMQYQNGVSTIYEYDAADRLLNLTNKKSSGVAISSYNYSYDKVGNRLNMTDVDTNTTSYEYDAVYRLINVTYPSGNSTRYTYDGVGNRLSKVNGTSTVPYTYDADNRLLTAGTASYSYDDNGNLISKTIGGDNTYYGYDYENRLTNVTLPGASQVTYNYSASGDRLSRSDSGGMIYYFYDSEDILMELDGNGVQEARYTHGPGIDEPISMNRSGVVSYCHFDGLGSVTLLTDANENAAASYKYDVFGAVVEDTGSVVNPYRFTSREWDEETGLYYYRARYYDPGVGRFIQKDVLEYIDGMNLYQHASNNPMRFVDPNGLVKNECPLKSIGTTITMVGYSRAIFNCSNNVRAPRRYTYETQVGTLSAKADIKGVSFSLTLPTGHKKGEEITLDMPPWSCVKFKYVYSCECKGGKRYWPIGGGIAMGSNDCGYWECKMTAEGIVDCNPEKYCDSCNDSCNDSCKSYLIPLGTGNSIESVGSWNYEGTVHNLGTYEWFPTIGAATTDLDTRDGDTLVVYPGIYYENINVTKQLTITSTTGDRADTTVIALNPDDHVFNVTADNVTISGFTVTGATGDEKAGIYLYGADHSVVSNNNVSSNYYGVRVSALWYCDIKDNFISNNTNSGIKIGEEGQD